MNFNEYQKLARQTAIYVGAGKNFVYPSLGLCGETGEVAEKIKKIIRDENSVISEASRRDLEKELGDVLWYVANLAFELGLDLEDIAQKNVSKLKSRKDRGVLHGSGDDR